MRERLEQRRLSDAVVAEQHRPPRRVTPVIEEMESLFQSEAADAADRDRREVPAGRGGGGLAGSLFRCHDRRWPRAYNRSKPDPVPSAWPAWPRASPSRRLRRPGRDVELSSPPVELAGRPRRLRPRSRSFVGGQRRLTGSGVRLHFQEIRPLFPIPRLPRRRAILHARRVEVASPWRNPGRSKNKPAIPVRWQAPRGGGTFRSAPRAFLSEKEAFRHEKEVFGHENEPVRRANEASRVATQARRCGMEAHSGLRLNLHAGVPAGRRFC